MGMNLVEKIESLEKELQELKKEIAMKSDVLPSLYTGQNGYHVNSFGAIKQYGTPHRNIETDMIFETEEQAKQYKERTEMSKVLWKMSIEWNKDWVINWSEFPDEKHYVRYDHCSKTFDTHSFYQLDVVGAPIFRSKEQAEKAIQKLKQLGY
jgi:hypothetical protein